MSTVPYPWPRAARRRGSFLSPIPFTERRGLDSEIALRAALSGREVEGSVYDQRLLVLQQAPAERRAN